LRPPPAKSGEVELRERRRAAPPKAEWAIVEEQPEQAALKEAQRQAEGKLMLAPAVRLAAAL
jgi:hypothetical protein